jgi:hypothetical protein
MASVSQNGRRPRRPWTAQDQIVAEVAAACGVGCREIGRMLDRTHVVVVRHLNPAVAEKSREYSLRWQQQNPDKKREADRHWYQSNSEKVCERSRQWRKDNADRLREYMRSWHEANSEKVRESQSRYRLANRDKVREKKRRRYACKRAARRHALHPVTQQQIDVRFMLWGNRCAFCGVNASHRRNTRHERLTVDHVLALTKGGLDDAGNIIPACHACNSSKNNNLIEVWYRQQPFFTDVRWRKIQRHCPAAVVGQLPLALVG